MSQGLLLAWDTMTLDELRDLVAKMRNSYYSIRNLRAARFGDARRRKEYRKVALLKKRLLLCGVEKREVLDLIACCRLQCPARKQPFLFCKHCGQGRNLADRSAAFANDCYRAA